MPAKKKPAPPAVGRPALPEDVRRSESLRVRCTVAEIAAYYRIGGNAWLRRKLAAEIKRGAS
jgi:hypothetical protein